MATAIQRRRGTATQHGSFTGLAGEITIDTTNNTVVVHDGSTAGGHRLAKYSEITSLGDGDITAVVAGAGLIGSTMAIALASKGLNVTVVDGTSEEDRIRRNKGRTYALSRTSKNLLINLGLWDPKRLKVSPIENIILSMKNSVLK